MAHLNQKQYDYRRESAAARNSTNEEIAVQNGMSEEQAELISKLCAIRHEFHCNMDSLTKSSEDHDSQEFQDWYDVTILAYMAS